jgi:putative intracellular protease/amidase
MRTTIPKLLRVLSLGGKGALLIVITLLPAVLVAAGKVALHLRTALRPPELPALSLKEAPRPPAPARRIGVVVAGNGGAEMTDFLIPYDVLGSTGAFDLYVVAPEKKLLPLASAGSLDGGLDLLPHFSLEEYDRSIGQAPDVIIIPYLPGFARGGEPGLVEWIQRQSARGALVVSICAGTEVLAATGLIDGERATTHPGFFARLEQSRPQVKWIRDVRYVESARAISSGAIASGMDASLAAVRRLLGAPAAREVAARLGYAHLHFLEEPGFQTTLFVPGLLVSTVFGFGKERLAVGLYEGVGESELGSVFDTYATSGRFELYGVAPERAILASRHGLWLVPRFALADAPRPGRLVLPGRSLPAGASGAVEAWAVSQGVEVTRLHQGSRDFPYDAALLDIARSESRTVARDLARILNYPVSHLALEGRAMAFTPVLLPVGLIALGAFGAWRRGGGRRGLPSATG